MAHKLSNAALGHIAERGVATVPSYDRSALRAGIAHFGVGAFHRAHQAPLIDELLQNDLARDWAIVGVGLMPADTRTRDALRDQDFLYTLVEKHTDGSARARVIGSIIDYLYAPDDPQRVLELLTDPGIRIVSLTITEGGYNINQVTGAFQLDTPAVAADLHGEDPTTVFGYLIEALARRRANGTVPFTVMSCDNLQNNGEVARHALTTFAAAKDPELGEWIETHVAFPNSMVDRITPATTGAHRAEVRETYGIDDAWPVVAEPFFQWVLEDAFTAGRPPYEQTAVQLTGDVEPYELMKLRLLNSSHQGLCYFGHLMGHHYVHDAVEEPLITKLLTKYMELEATPTLKPLPGVDLGAYRSELITRFANPAIADTVPRLCAESSDRIPKWLIPVVRDQLSRAEPRVELSAAIVASWARYAEGVDERGEPIDVVDNLKGRVMAAARAYPHDHRAFLRDEELFGDLADREVFAGAYDRALRLLHEKGARAALEEILTGY